MGWDAHAVFDKNAPDYKNAKKAFKAASKVVTLIYDNTVDGNLHLGGLDCSICGELLEKATSRSVYEDWGIGNVKTNECFSIWNKGNIEEKDMWAYYSAKFFLKICARYNLAITFTY